MQKADAALAASKGVSDARHCNRRGARADGREHAQDAPLFNSG
jgi:hypothetical protein